ncbi:MAG: rhomboid family protein [halophilic archaeon J07HX5]|jgi:Rhomboid family.|nr:MAG: rhomboid family protein [halophilic archaeon J07HX5]
MRRADGDYTQFSDSLTIVFVTANTLVFLTQVLLLIVTAPAAFEFWFVAQVQPTPGIVLGPLSHEDPAHFVLNMLLFGLVGWAVERRIKRRAYGMFVAITAYLPVYLQVGVSYLVTGETGTMGFSGAIYALVPLYAIVQTSELLRDGDGGVGHDTKLPAAVLAIVVTAAIPLLVGGQLSVASDPAEPARVAHATGYLSGLLYGLIIVLTR